LWLQIKLFSGPTKMGVRHHAVFSSLSQFGNSLAETLVVNVAAIIRDNAAREFAGRVEVVSNIYALARRISRAAALADESQAGGNPKWAACAA
jgi:hypothetical protein